MSRRWILFVIAGFLRTRSYSNDNSSKEFSYREVIRCSHTHGAQSGATSKFSQADASHGESNA